MSRNTRLIRIRFIAFSRATPSGYAQASIRTYSRTKGRRRGKYAGIRLSEPLTNKMFGLVPAALNSLGAVRKKS